MSELAPASARLSERARVLIFCILSLGQLIALLDIQIVAGALGPIQAGLSAGPDEVAWVQTAYLMAEIVMIPLAAFLARAFSTRWLFVGSAALFTVSSLMCGLAWDLETMIVFRALQGFTGGAMIPTVFAMGYALFEGRLRERMTAMVGLLSTLAPTLGPSIGGFITDISDWRWLFFINIGPGLLIVCVLPLLGKVDEARPELLRRIDWVHVGSLALFLGGLQYVLEEGPRHEWLGDVGVATAAWLTIVAAVVFLERSFNSANPVVRLTPLRRPTFALACLLNLVIGFGLYATIYLTPVFLGQVRHYTSLQIGGVVLVSGFFMAVGAPIAMRLSALLGGRAVIGIGFTLFAVFLWMYSAITPQWGFGELFWPQVVRGLAILMCIFPAIAMALGGVPQSELHNASGLFNLMRNLGGAIGIAVVNTWLIDFGRWHGLRIREGLGQAAEEAVVNLGVIAAREGADPAAALGAVQDLLAREAATMAFADVFRLMAWVFVATLLIVPFCKVPPSPGAEEAGTVH
ncbi:MAG: DHA2 family efflux MFS transporter permease subunit [Pseudomonadota bacterium]